MPEDKREKSFWSKPEGVTGIIFLMLLLGGLGTFAFLAIDSWGNPPEEFIAGVATTVGLISLLFAIPRTRKMIGYGFRSTMRWITGLFVELDPMKILDKHVNELTANIKHMKRQMGQLRGQIHKLNELIFNNKREISTNLKEASEAKNNNSQKTMILKSRKAGRLQESNMKLTDLYNRMQVLYRVLKKMHDNSEILVEDIKYQVEIKQKEREAIHASHSAMKSARSIIQGDPDKRAMFDLAMEAMSEDVSNKIGEIEQFMHVSANFMDSIDLQNGVFEENGLKMLEKWEKESDSLILDDKTKFLLDQVEQESKGLDLNEPPKRKEKVEEKRENQYDSFFDF